jgi:hypothetical protein
MKAKNNEGCYPLPSAVAGILIFACVLIGAGIVAYFQSHDFGWLLIAEGSLVLVSLFIWTTLSVEYVCVFGEKR